MAADRRVLKNTVILTAANYANAGVNFILFILLARSVPVEVFGAFTASFVVALIIFQVCELGMAQILTKRVAQDPAASVAVIRRIFTLRCLLAVVGMALIGLAVWCMPPASHMRSLTLLFGVMAALEFLAEVFLAAFRGYERMSVEGLVNVSRGLLMLLGGVVVILAASRDQLVVPVETVLAGIFVLGAVTKFGLGLAFVGRRLAWRVIVLDVPYTREFLRESIPLGLANLLTHAVNRLDMVLLAVLAGAGAAGFYGPAQQLYNGLTILWTAFLLAVLPHLSAMIVRDPTAFWRAWKRSAALLLAVTLGLAGVGWVWAQPLVVAIYGSAYEPSGGPFQLLMAANVFFALGSLCGVGLTAMGVESTIFRVHLARAAIHLPVLLWCIPRYGFLGAAAATLFAHAIGCVGLVAAVAIHASRLIESRAQARMLVQPGAT